MPCRWQADFFPLKVTEDKTADVITLTAVKAASQKCREDPNGIKQGVGIDITVELAVIGIRAVFPNEVKSLGCIGFGADINRKRTESFPLSCSEIMHHEKPRMCSSINVSSSGMKQRIVSVNPSL